MGNTVEALRKIEENYVNLVTFTKGSRTLIVSQK